MAQTDRVAFGLAAEDQAVSYLQRLGYTLITRRYKGRHGEVDVICLDGEVLVFVEVKARRASGYSPEEAVGGRKLENIARTAAEYAGKFQIDREVRFDVVAIDRKGLRHHRDVSGHRS